MLIKVMILIVILACAGPFFIKGPDGKPLMSLDELMGDWSGGPGELLPDMLSPSETAPVPETVYRWQDENGVWQFSNDPADAARAEEMVLDQRNVNIVESFKIPERAERGTAQAASGKTIPGVATVSPSQAAELMDTVTNLQETIDQRKADMDEISNLQTKKK